MKGVYCPLFKFMIIGRAKLQKDRQGDGGRERETWEGGGKLSGREPERKKGANIKKKVPFPGLFTYDHFDVY